MKNCVEETQSLKRKTFFRYSWLLENSAKRRKRVLPDKQRIRGSHAARSLHHSKDLMELEFYLTTARLEIVVLHNCYLNSVRRTSGVGDLQYLTTARLELVVLHNRYLNSVRRTSGVGDLQYLTTAGLELVVLHNRYLNSVWRTGGVGDLQCLTTAGLELVVLHIRYLNSVRRTGGVGDPLTVLDNRRIRASCAAQSLLEFSLENWWS
jgi:hypothetical protein